MLADDKNQADSPAEAAALTNQEAWLQQGSLVPKRSSSRTLEVTKARRARTGRI